MPQAQQSIVRKSFWTIGTYAASALVRFGTNIVLSRLLGPEVMGIVVIAQAIRTGCDLLTDLGLEQNVVHSPNGDDERFLNTIWTMQVGRGLLISLMCCALAPVLATFYRVETPILIVVSAAPLLNALMSTSIFTLARRLDVKRRNLFELSAELVGLVINVALALALRSVWAPVLGILLSIAARSLLAYGLPGVRHRFMFDKVHAPAIFHFSKWIMLSSLAFYASVYVDRLYLGRVVPLATLGIYGLAKSIAELPNTVTGRLAFQIVFPFVARQEDGLGDGSAGHRELTAARRNFLVLLLAGVGTVMAWPDWAVRLLYGPRYAAAGWMLCLMLGGTWIAVLASLNEAIVFGRGKPNVVSAANILRFATMLVVLPAGFALWGLPGAFLAVPAAEFIRYLVLLRAQIRLKMTLIGQDTVLTLGLLALLGAWVALRLGLGLGVPWALMG